MSPDEARSFGKSYAVVTASRVVGGQRQGLTITTKLLIEFLSKSVTSLLAVDHPFLVDPDIAPLMEVYASGRLVARQRAPLPRALSSGGSFSSSFLNYLALKVLDVVSTVMFVLKRKEVIDVYIGVEALNALTGVFLRRLGRVRKVIYYTFDYSRRRFPSSLASTFFLLLDEYGLRASDVVWNAIENIGPMRAKLLGIGSQVEQIVVPGANPPPDPRDFFPRSQHRIVYLGSLGERWGVQTVISALPAVLRSTPDAEFHVIGHGPYQGELKRQAAKLGIEDKVVFHGFLPDDETRSLLKLCRLGVAPYPDPGQSLRSSELDSSKVKYYALYGVPVVISSVAPTLTHLVQEYGAGLSVPPSPEAFSTAITRLLKDENFYSDSVQGCFKLADHFNADRIYKKVLEKTFEILAKRNGNGLRRSRKASTTSA